MCATRTVSTARIQEKERRGRGKTSPRVVRVQAENKRQMEQARELGKRTEYMQELSTVTGAPQSNRMTDCLVDDPRKKTGSQQGEKQS